MVWLVLMSQEIKIHASQDDIEEIKSFSREKLESYAKRYPDLDLSTLTTSVQSELIDIYENENNTEKI